MPHKVLDYDWLRRTNERQAALNEAKSLLVLERNGCPGGPCATRCRDIDTAIGVKPDQYLRLTAFINAHPEERPMVASALRFRRLVAVEVAKQRAAREAA